MSTLRMTALQKAILNAVSTTERSNAQIAEAAGCSEAYASRVLTTLLHGNRHGLRSRFATDIDDPQTRFRMWRKG